MNGYEHNSIILNNWTEVEWYVDSTSLRFTASYLDLVNSGRFPHDAFTLGQLASKGWLFDELLNIKYDKKHSTAVILGCWVATLVQPLYNAKQRSSMTFYGGLLDRVYGVDLDPMSIDLSEQFNHRLVQDGWKYKGVVADCAMLDCNDMEFQTGGELIQCRPDIVINTSCEHMDTDWFHTCDDGQLIVMQTNDSDDYDGHINTCKSQQEMWDKYPMRNQLFTGEMRMPAYTRYMQIGYK